MTPEFPRWPRLFLRIAAIYNLAWGTWVILFPNMLFDLLGMERLNHPSIWQCVGMIVGVYGVGYWIAASDVRRFWPVVLVGFLGKLLGPIGFVFTALSGELPWAWGGMLIANDLVWWLPFATMLYLVLRYESAPSGATDKTWSVEEANKLPLTASSKSLGELSTNRGLILIFLRHAGCTFCRQTLRELAQRKTDFLAKGLTPVVVHMGSVEQGERMLSEFSLSEIEQISDPDCRLFKAYQLPRGTIGQLLSWDVWWRGFKSAILERHGFGKVVGDGFQLSGSFLLRDGRILKSFPAKNAAAPVPWSELTCPTT